MESTIPVPEGAKARKRAVARPTKGQGDQKPKRTKVGLLLSEESARKLGLHSVMEGRDRSDIVEQLIRDHLRGWVVQWRPGSSPTETLSAE